MEIEIDRKKLFKMQMRIIQLEKKNVKNKEKTDKEMVDLIRNIISEELKKNI